MAVEINCSQCNAKEKYKKQNTEKTKTKQQITKPNTKTTNCPPQAVPKLQRSIQNYTEQTEVHI